MTQPAQDNTFELDPQAMVIALTAQRNDAQDEAARWRAVALQERQTTQMLAAEIAELKKAPTPNRAARRSKGAAAAEG